MTDRKETYESLLRVYDHNGVRVSLSTFFLTMVAHGPHELDQTQKAIQAAKNNGVFIEVNGQLIKKDRETIKKAIQIEANSLDPDKDVIGKLNQVKDGLS